MTPYQNHPAKSTDQVLGDSLVHLCPHCGYGYRFLLLNNVCSNCLRQVIASAETYDKKKKKAKGGRK